MTESPEKTPNIRRYQFRLYVVLLLISILIMLIGIFTVLVMHFTIPPKSP
jgi:hypothetical protein